MFDKNMIEKVYAQYPKKLSKARAVLGRKLTLTEKILYTHLHKEEAVRDFNRGVDYVEFSPDRVALQDATAQMALLQFMQAKKERVEVPTTVHCDHLIQAETGAQSDLKSAQTTNKEIYDFLATVCQRYDIGFWKPGAGIIHQIILENYAFPGGMLIGADSHTVNAGGLGMIAVGVGGADGVDVMVGLGWELLFPKLVGIKLSGKLSGWASAKDVILKVAGIMTVKGGTGKIIEYFGPGAETISATGKGTIANMGAEIGATTSLFPYDASMKDYLNHTGRAALIPAITEIAGDLSADEGVYENPEQYFDEVIEINLSELEPYVNGPFTPDRAIPLSKLRTEVEANDWPSTLEVGLIGSCTNSSYEDITRAASIAAQASEKQLKVKSEFTITPGSEQIRQTVERDGYLDAFKEVGGLVLANACGPCIGQWKRHSNDPNRKNTIITSFNRNFAKRNDGNPNTHAFVASPEIVTALVFGGSLKFNPMTDELVNENGDHVKLEAPKGLDFPPNGFIGQGVGFVETDDQAKHSAVHVDPNSQRLQLLEPFDKFAAANYKNLTLLLKAKGKCTTDHISMAGPWLRLRGHLDKISDNMFIGATNAFNDKTNSVKNALTGAYRPVPETQREYRNNNIATIVVGDTNYGEGSSREHAAMEPRHLGVRVILVRSFARIHETNLKKQGMLALTFADPSDYDKIREDDKFDIVAIEAMAPKKPLEIIIRHADGLTETIRANHSYNQKQLTWFTAGSALNLIRQKAMA
ncbi:aconitate hydratase [Spirochaetota bacterium]|nr:aconitate hydratase [Spirochaetota bacterium]